jgi:CRP/FNR family transcriptional regulator, cyclic AMP receptor protein
MQSKDRGQVKWRMLVDLCGGRVSPIKAGQVIFRQGEAADELYFLAKGRAKATVVSKCGKEGVVDIVLMGEFFGERCLRDHATHIATVTALADGQIVRMPAPAVVQAMQTNPSFAGLIGDFLLTRIDKLEADVINHLFNSGERRLARLLLMLAHFGDDGYHAIAPQVDQKTLAGMIGTTRPRVSAFMSKFRKEGHIQYESGRLVVHNTLLNVALSNPRGAS